MNELVVLGQLGPFTLTVYALCLLAGAAAAIAMTAYLGRKTPGVNACLSMSMAALVGAVIGGRVVYCVTQWEFILVDLGGAAFMAQPWQGGYNMYGAVLGGLAGVAIYSRATKKPACALMDLAAPGAALAIFAGRLGEAFTSQGLGAYVDSEALQRFPFAVENLWGDWQLPVFAYEAAAALATLIVCLCLLRGDKRRSGRVAEVFISLISLCQVLLESLRADEFIRFGFVKFNMLAAAVALGGVIFTSVWRQVKRGGWKPWQIFRLILFALSIVVVILIEFALDKSPIDNRLLYAVMALMLTLMGVSVLREGK